MSVFFTAEAAFQRQKKVIVLKQDSQAFHTGSKEKIHNKKMACILHMELGIRRCDSTVNVKMQNHNSFPQKVMCGDAEQRTVPLNAANPDFDLGKKH